MAASVTRKKSLARRFWWVPFPLAIALLLVIPFFRPIKFNVGNKGITVAVQTLTPNGPFADEGVFIRTGWDGPTGSFSACDTFGLKLGNRLLRLDIVTDPIAAARRRLPKTLPGLVATLDSKDDWLKFCAMQALADMGASAQPALPALLNALGRGDTHAEDAFLKVSKASGAAAMPDLTNALGSSNATVREKAAEALGEIGAEAKPSIPVLKARLHDAEPRVIVHSALALWKVDSRTHGAVPVLVQLLTRDNPEVRAMGAATLGELGGESAEAVPALMTALEDRDPMVRAMSARTLGLIGPQARAAIPRLIVRLDDSDAAVLMWTCMALGQLGEDAKGAIPKLRQMALREDSGRWAVEALGLLGPEAVPSLVEACRDVGRNRYFAARGLIKLGPRAGAAVPFLRDELNGTNVNGIILAAQVLGHLGDEARVALPHLTELLSDDNARVRVRAAEALWRLDRQTNAVLPILLATLRDESIHTGAAKRCAVETLGEMGPAANEAVPLLEMMLQNPQTSLRKFASQALEKIAGRPQ